MCYSTKLILKGVAVIYLSNQESVQKQTLPLAFLLLLKYNLVLLVINIIDFYWSLNSISTSEMQQPRNKRVKHHGMKHKVLPVWIYHVRIPFVISDIYHLHNISYAWHHYQMRDILFGFQRQKSDLSLSFKFSRIDLSQHGGLRWTGSYLYTSFSWLQDAEENDVKWPQLTLGAFDLPGTSPQLHKGLKDYFFLCSSNAILKNKHGFLAFATDLFFPLNWGILESSVKACDEQIGALMKKNKMLFLRK